MGVRSLGGSGKIYNDIGAESGWVDHIPTFEPAPPAVYPTLSAFTDSSDGRYDAITFISGNDMNILDWGTGSKVSRGLDYSGTITAGNADVAAGAPAKQTGSLSISSSGTNWIGADTTWSATGARSLSMWLKTSSSSSQVFLMHCQASGDMPLVNSCADIRMHPVNGNYADYRPSTDSIPDLNNNTWRHIVFVQNGSNDRYWYIDGVLRQQNVNQNGSYDSASWDGAGNEVTFFGSRGGVTTGRSQFGGSAYGIRVFDFAISQAQASALYNAKV